MDSAAILILRKSLMTSNNFYTTQLGAGLGMIQETLNLLHLWEPGIKPAQLSEQAIKTGTFARATARRTRNIVTEMFAPRYLTNNGLPAKNYKLLNENGFPNNALAQLFFLQTARAQTIFFDFVINVYWPKYMVGSQLISKNDAVDFLLQALDEGKMQKRWSESTIKRVAGYLLGCCKDFRLTAVKGRQGQSIQHFSIRNEVALYLAYELHFNGASDMNLVANPDWCLFGLDHHDVIRLLKNISSNQHFIIQTSADLVQISWKYKTFEELLNVLTKR
jgi:hypothetical protein